MLRQSHEYKCFSRHIFSQQQVSAPAQAVSAAVANCGFSFLLFVSCLLRLDLNLGRETHAQKEMCILKKSPTWQEEVTAKAVVTYFFKTTLFEADTISNG